MIDDEKIIEMFFGRSEQGIRELDIKYGKICHNLSYNIVNSRQDAEECVNDAYLGAWNAIPPVRPNPLLSYIVKIVRNISLKIYCYYVNGALQAAPAVNAGPPMTVTGITVPAGGSALVIYETEVTRYAPLAAESSIVNTVTVTGGGLAAPVTAEETVGVVSSPTLSITKGLNPTVVAENGRITYTFTIQNTGNTPVTATDDVILRDTFDPVLNGLTVTYNGAPWTAGTQYTYDGTTGLFATTAGQITVPAATYTQDPVTGAWAVTPGVSELIVTGTV